MLLFSLQCNEAKRKIPTKTDDDLETDEIVYTSDKDLKDKVNELASKKYKKPNNDDSTDDFELSYSQRKKLAKDELALLKKLELITELHGALSKERAKALSSLGANIYKQGKYEESFKYSKEILNIHEKLDGVESEITGQVLQNVGSVACKLHLINECKYAFERSLYIILNIHGMNSKEVIYISITYL